MLLKLKTNLIFNVPLFPLTFSLRPRHRCLRGGDWCGLWVVVEIDVRWLLRSMWVYSGCWDRLVAICFDVGRGEWWIWLLGCVYGVGGGDEVDWCWLLGCGFVGWGLLGLMGCLAYDGRLLGLWVAVVVGCFAWWWWLVAMGFCVVKL